MEHRVIKIGSDKKCMAEVLVIQTAFTYS